MAHLLLVDADDLLRDTVQQLLEMDGHRVSAVANGLQALALLGWDGSIELLITDVAMPGMDGAQLIVEARRLRPALPVIAISGGRRALSPPWSLAPADLAGNTLPLPKPFGQLELRAALRQALAGGPA